MSELDLDVVLERGDFRLAVKLALPGQGITAISGPSGSGKTTLLRIIAGIEESASGELRYGGALWQGQGVFVRPDRRRIGMVFQEPRLFPHLDVQANLMFGAQRAGVSEAQVSAIAAEFGLQSLLSRRVRGLSGGEQRRVALARALAMQPGLLCLDEPLTGLDAKGRDELLPYLARAVARADCPALLVSHHADEIAALADRLVRLENGALITPDPVPVPDCYDLPVIAAGGGRVQLEMGHNIIELSGEAEPGSTRRLRMPQQHCLICLSPPEHSSAPAQLEGLVSDIRSLDTGSAEVAVEVGGHRVALELHEDKLAQLRLSFGQRIWLLPMSLQLMPARRM